MAKSLFALESDDIAAQVEELETTPEEGQAAALQAQTESEGAEVSEITDAIDGGLQASDQLEEVQDVLAQAGSDGISPVAAESLRLAISAIASNIGANPQAVYSLYAVENFQSASSRQANTQIALEGVQEFLQDLWKKIKAALTKMWAKMKDFWVKHASASGQMLKAVESMKSRVKASSGKISGKAYLDEAPSAVVSYYRNAKDITAQVAHGYLLDVSLFEKMTQANEKLATSIKKVAEDTGLSDSEKTNAALTKLVQEKAGSGFSIPVVGGEDVHFKTERDSDVGDFTMTITRTPSDELEDKPGMTVADKPALLTLLNDAQALVKSVMAYQKNTEKSAQKFNEAMVAVEKLISASDKVSSHQAAHITGRTGIASDDPKIVRKLLRMIYKASSVEAKGSAVLISESFKSCKAALAYTAACLKQYK